MSSTLRIHVTLALILIYVTFTRALRRGGGEGGKGVHSASRARTMLLI